MRLIIVCRQVTSLSLSFPTLYPCINIWSYSRVCLSVCRPYYTLTRRESAPVFGLPVIRDGMCCSQVFFFLSRCCASSGPLRRRHSSHHHRERIYNISYIQIDTSTYEMLCVSGDGEVYSEEKSQETSLFIGWHQVGKKRKKQTKKFLVFFFFFFFLSLYARSNLIPWAH
jgi:hypothetical protein